MEVKQDVVIFSFLTLRPSEKPQAATVAEELGVGRIHGEPRCLQDGFLGIRP
jgi:hypothetical protein